MFGEALDPPQYDPAMLTLEPLFFIQDEAASFHYRPEWNDTDHHNLRNSSRSQDSTKFSAREAWLSKFSDRMHRQRKHNTAGLNGDSQPSSRPETPRDRNGSTVSFSSFINRIPKASRASSAAIPMPSPVPGRANSTYSSERSYRLVGNASQLTINPQKRTMLSVPEYQSLSVEFDELPVEAKWIWKGHRGYSSMKEFVQSLPSV